MKKLIILFSIFFMALGTNITAQEKKEEPEFATIVFWVQSYPHPFSVDINNIKTAQLNNHDICLLKIYSKGEVLINSQTYLLSGSKNIEISNNDTIYINISASTGRVFLKIKTKDEYLMHISKRKKINIIKISENLNSPYNPGSFTISKPKEKTGTGFLISDKGYIVTNHHVIDNADKITISGINGNFESELSAKVVLKDEASDLAILKIEDRILIDPIPYVIIPEQSAIGENVFLLGFPYIKTMGTDVKLTNGIVSSKSGYEGNINSYQVSAPAQPGNSGGPVFDANGRIIAIVNAKHTLAENASYAIKSKYLLDLLENLDEKIELNKTNQLAGLTLPQQVEKAQQFIVIIKTK